MTHDEPAPNALGRQDAAALIGVIATLEGHLVAGNLDPHVVDHLYRRLQSDGLVEPGSGPAQLRLVLSNLNQRLRYALGEDDELPPPATGAVDLHFGFAVDTDAQAFTEAVRAQGLPSTAPVAVDGRSYDDDTVRWEVAVRSPELPLSAGFSTVQQRLRELSAEHAGTEGGWGGAPPGLTP